jgi:hypothetical protein
VVHELARQLGLLRSGHALAEQHPADQGQFADRFEALEEAHFRIDVGLQAESVAMGPQPLQGADADGVYETGVGHPGAPCSSYPWCVPPSSVRHLRVCAAANAAIKVEW